MLVNSGLRGETRHVLFLEQVQWSLQIQGIVLVFDQQSVEFLYQYFSVRFLRLLGTTATLSRRETPTEGDLFLLLLHLLDVVAQQLPHLAGYQILLLLRRLHLRKHRDWVHRSMRRPGVNEVRLRNGTGEAGEGRISKCVLEMSAGFVGLWASWREKGGAEVCLIEVLCHAGVEL